MCKEQKQNSCFSNLHFNFLGTGGYLSQIFTIYNYLINLHLKHLYYHTFFHNRMNTLVYKIVQICDIYTFWFLGGVRIRGSVGSSKRIYLDFSPNCISSIIGINSKVKGWRKVVNLFFYFQAEFHNSITSLGLEPGKIIPN